MKKIICVTLSLCFIVLCFTGCAKETTKEEFMQFAHESQATQFYKACLDFADAKNITYLKDKKNKLFFITDTLCCACEYTEENFKKALDGISNGTASLMDVPGYEINGEKYTVSVINNKRPVYGPQKDFGLIAVSEENPKVLYFWYFDMDNSKWITEGDKDRKSVV